MEIKGIPPRRQCNALPAIDDRSPRGRAFLRLAHFAWGEARRGAFLDASALASAELENALLAAYFDVTSLDAPLEQCHPRQIIRAIDYLRDHLADPVSIAQVAGAAGVSERSLRREFKKRFGVTVMEFLRRRRLEAAHQVLQTTEPGETTVTAVALRFGFSHLGRFSITYRQAFGCPPSETLHSSAARVSKLPDAVSD